MNHNAKQEQLPVECIRTDGGTQIRIELDPAAVDAYAEVIGDLPPVTVFHDGKNHWLADGFHRLAAHRQAKADDINCQVIEGTLEQAIEFACGANATHGLPRSHTDKRNAVNVAFQKHPDWSDRRIAQLCKVSPPLVAKLRSTINIYSGDKRKTADGRVMNTANIGKPSYESVTSVTNSTHCQSDLPLAKPERRCAPIRPNDDVRDMFKKTELAVGAVQRRLENMARRFDKVNAYRKCRSWADAILNELVQWKCDVEQTACKVNQAGKQQQVEKTATTSAVDCFNH